MKTKSTLCLLLCASGLILLPSAVALPPEPGAPEELTRPLQIIQKVRPAFPARLLRRGVKHGEVRVFLDVDASGVLVDRLVVAATHREFAEVVEDVVQYWRFIPTEFEGRGIATTAEVTVRFEVNGVVLVERNVGDDSPAARDKYVFHAWETDDLDRPPKAQRNPAPINPGRLGEKGVAGRVRVDFFIDERGRVRMPVVISADHERLGWAALAAVGQWRFDPPLRKGRPVLVRASQTFRFEETAN